MTSITKLFDKPKIIGVIADVNKGKSMTLYHIIESCRAKHEFKLYQYGLRVSPRGAVRVNSIEEIESIENSIVIIDELSSLFDLDNRKVKSMIENSLRLINHNNNVVILAGTPENFKKFVSAKLNVIFYKQATIADFINGSRAKNILMAYRGNERGSAMLNLPVDEALVWDGAHYSKVRIPYYPAFDTKRGNQPILKRVPKSVPNVVREIVEKVVKT